MADGKFKLSGTEAVVVSSLGDMTRGLGFPLVPVEDDTAAQAFVYVPIILSKSGNFRPDRYLRVGEVDTEDTPLTADADSELFRVVLSRSDADPDPAKIEILVNNVVRLTLNSIIRKQVYETDILVEAGDSLSIRNKTGSNTMRNVVMMLIFRSKVHI